ncbi:MAG: YbaK/EbsC family protein [Deinococcales bacterium]
MPETAPLSDRDLAAYLHAHGVSAELVRPGVPTPTVPEAARALGVGPEAIVKSLVFEIAGQRAGDAANNGSAVDAVEDGRQPLLVIAAGEARVRMPALARALGTSRRALRLASPERTLELTGYAVGSMPPFGHRRVLPTLVDSLSVPTEGVVFAGGGGRDVLLRVPVDTLLGLTRARRLPLTAQAAEGAKETNR